MDGSLWCHNDHEKSDSNTGEEHGGQRECDVSSYMSTTIGDSPVLGPDTHPDLWESSHEDVPNGKDKTKPLNLTSITCI